MDNTDRVPTVEGFIMAFLADGKSHKVEDLAKEMAIPEDCKVKFGIRLYHMYAYGYLHMNFNDWTVQAWLCVQDTALFELELSTISTN